MSSKPETTFYTGVHKYLPAGLHREKMHNSYRGGTADFWFSGQLHDLWVEYKFIVVPKRGDTVIDLVGGKNPSISALQQKWLFDRHVEGRNIWVVVGHKGGGVIMPGDSWDATWTTERFLAETLSRQDLAQNIYGFTG